MTLQIPTSSRDLNELQSVLLQAFSVPPPYWPKLLSDVEQKNFRILRQNNEIVGAFGLYENELWFGGNPVSSVGVACVAVPIIHRRAGHGHNLMNQQIRDAFSQQFGISYLYPSTDRFYQTLGYGHAGERVTRKLAPIPDIRRQHTLPIFELDPTNPSDFAQIQQMHLERARRGHGCHSRTRGHWSRLIRPPGTTVRFYGFGQPSAPEGWVCTAQVQSGSPYPLLFADQVILSPAAGRTLWLVAALHRPTAGELKWHGPTKDPLTLHLPQADWVIEQRKGWMLRLLHLPTAFETRGYPAHINGVLRMSIHDSVIPENSGHWELTVQSGKGVLTRGGAGGLETNMSTLSTLYSGFYTAQSLQDAGQLRGSESDIALANQLFNGPEPYCPDAF